MLTSETTNALTELLPLTQIKWPTTYQVTNNEGFLSGSDARTL